MDLAHRERNEDMKMYRKNPTVKELDSMATRFSRLQFLRLAPWPEKIKLGAWIEWRAAVDTRISKEDKFRGRIIQVTNDLVAVKDKHYIRSFTRQDLHDKTVELL